jgi:hypothetical protein
MAILILAICCLFYSKMTAQIIQIDSTFTTDGEIFPFAENDIIYGLSISGSVTLLSDTSMVRVILTDNSGQEWMVYEAYPFISPQWEFEITEASDETMFRRIINPGSLKIQIINASLGLDNAILQNRYRENLEILQENFKNTIEFKKVDSLNHVIELNDMLWFANRNPVSDLSYFDKANRFGEKYNLLGLDYYTSGIYDARPGVEGPADNSALVDSFDWRNRHGANDPSKSLFYYNSEPYANGWLTPVEDQSEIPLCDSLCYIYGPLAAIEGVANIYFNNCLPMKNYNLSEQHVLDCDLSTNDCHGGLDFVTNIFARDTGIVDEACYPRDNTHGNCRQNSPPIDTAKNKIRIAGYHANYHYNADTIKVTLINHGPLEVSLSNYSGNSPHSIALVGYGTVKARDTLYDTSFPYDTIIVHDNSNYIGQLFWIFKNSWGSGYGDHGYFYHFENDVHIAGATYYLLPFDDLLSVNDTITPYDKDHDGYWNWGISAEYDLPVGACSDLKDSDDSENRIGPFDPHYNGTPVKPEMEVTGGPLKTPITNHGFYFIQDLDPQNIDIVISNPGNAQLNLAYITPVTIIDDGLIEFSLFDNHQPEPKICIGHSSAFKVQFDPNPNEDHSALVQIQLHQCDNDVYDHFEFTILYGDCTFNPEAYPVTEYELWDGYRVMNQDVNIAYGATLEVFGSIAMNEESDIFVEPGGQLILNGGLITGSCRNLWHGIDIWGDPREHQTPDRQGMVSIINGGCIEYAETAIETAIHTDRGGLYPTGGIISCTDAIFKDNVTDIHFYPYTSTHPNNHEIIPNFSNFLRTRFETTVDLYSIFGHPPDIHLLMDEVGGINIMGCSFGNYYSQTTYSRGTGIESNGAGYFVYQGCAQNIIPCPEILPCRFENLDYGIHALNNYGYFTVTVNSAEFIHNRRGIYLGLVDNATIIRSTFNISDPEHLQPNDTLVGLYLDAFTTGFVVEENTFTGPSTISKTVGIHLMNTGTNQNEIYNNRFSTLKQGIMAVGTNRLSPDEENPVGWGLCIKCNDFDACNNDVWVTPVIINGISYPTQNTGIAQQQGEINQNEPYNNTIAAGNTFSVTSSSNYYNHDDCGRIYYTYHGNYDPVYKIIPFPTYGDFHSETDPHADYSKTDACPSHLGGSITLSLEKSILSYETSLISSYEDTLAMLIDGGNTESLNFEVLTSYPDEALSIRQELIEKSPYLSDTIMISAIGKEEVLPGAMVRDILVSNPQAPKSKKIMNALDQRQDTIPDYMMEEIMQGLNTFGTKELLEQKLGSHQVKKEKAWTNINLFYKNDTTNWNQGIDSLIALYENQNKLSDKYELAFLFLDKSDSTNAFGILNSIPGEFDLDEQELLVHDQYQDLFEILWDTKNDSIRLDSLQIQALLEMSSVSNGLPAIFASNLLIKEGILIYNEPVYLGEEFVKSDDIPAKKTAIQNEPSTLKLFPNPAGNYFIAMYDLIGKEDPGILTITDISGKSLISIQLKDKQNQVVIPSKDFSQGSYLVNLIVGNNLVCSAKLIITK